MAENHLIAVFIAQLIVLIIAGRGLGEVMSRLGQPAIFGQLLAGVLLGPSVFGVLLPGARHVLFPDNPALKAMIDAVSQIGILLLLLLTGMETNLALIRRRRRAVISSSVFGIAVPFVCGVALTYALPAALIPSVEARLVTALFLGTALSISSVKIVAMVLMEVGAVRRDLGQLILATAILDDTIAWIMIAIIAGIAAYGAVDLRGTGASLAGALLFLAVSFTVGRRLVARIIRWANDSLTIEVPVISAILAIMLAMALTTDLIGVHTALGAFVAGMLIGQSPILTEHIEGELRGFIIAFFSPVFFAVAGLGMDLRTLLDPTLVMFTIAVILVASVGKFLGALAGGRIGGLTMPESLALATGLNARGSTEVIIASIGLSMGALGKELFTMIVAMAVITTMAMPPTLRAMLARVPMRDDEAKRLEAEEAEETQLLPRMERALVLLDDSANGRMAARIAGLFAARQQVLATVIEPAGEAAERPGHQAVADAVVSANERIAGAAAARDPAREPAIALDDMLKIKEDTGRDAIAAEVVKGYSIVIAGLASPISPAGNRFDDRLGALDGHFDGPLAIALNGNAAIAEPGSPLSILVPTGGSTEALLAIEIALALAHASGGSITALHVVDPQEDADVLRGRARRHGASILVDARRLARRCGVPMQGIFATHEKPEIVIQRTARRGRHDLVVIGTSLRQGGRRFLGARSTGLVANLRCPVLIVTR